MTLHLTWSSMHMSSHIEKTTNGHRTLESHECQEGWPLSATLCLLKPKDVVSLLCYKGTLPGHVQLPANQDPKSPSTKLISRHRSLSTYCCRGVFRSRSRYLPLSLKTVMRFLLAHFYSLFLSFWIVVLFLQHTECSPQLGIIYEVAEELFCHTTWSYSKVIKQHQPQYWTLRDAGLLQVTNPWLSSSRENEQMIDYIPTTWRWNFAYDEVWVYGTFYNSLTQYETGFSLDISTCCMDSVVFVFNIWYSFYGWHS